MNVTKDDGRAGGQEVSPHLAGELLDGLTEIVAQAAAAILAVPFSQITQRIKPDRTPVTNADEASEAAILEGLARLLPSVPVVSEESIAPVSPSIGASVAIVDPLDGTKEFLAGRDEFTVNLAIVSNGAPVAGLIAAPAQGLLWRGVAGAKAERLRVRWSAETAQIDERTPIRTRPAPDRLVAATSRSHLDELTQEFLARLPLAKRYVCGSSVKFCHLAQGEADIYPRLSPIREWDIAAGCAILTAAGGTVTDAQGAPLRFGRAEARFLVPGFIAWGDPALAGPVQKYR